MSTIHSLRVAVERLQRCQKAVDETTLAEDSETRKMLVAAAANTDGNNHWDQAHWKAIQSAFKQHDAASTELSSAIYAVLKECLGIDVEVLKEHEKLSVPGGPGGAGRMRQPADPV